jgi:hypothetical protein
MMVLLVDMVVGRKRCVCGGGGGGWCLNEE